MRNDRIWHLANKFDVFVFDWDGTLNNMRIITKVNESVKRALGIWNRDSSIKDFRGMDYNLKQRMESSESYRNSLISTLAEMVLVLSRPRLHNDTLELLQMLKKRGKRIAILSNARSYRLLSELSYLKITDYFDVIISTRDIKAMKPNPTGLKAILHFLKAKPGSVLYIGDMVDDVLTAKLAKVPSCAVADGFDSYHRLKSAKPDYLFSGIESLKAAL
jgi:phosphoglycolate phosphatase-like HAD superfamily hydrolase